MNRFRENNRGSAELAPNKPVVDLPDVQEVPPAVVADGGPAGDLMSATRTQLAAIDAAVNAGERRIDEQAIAGKSSVTATFQGERDEVRASRGALRSSVKSSGHAQVAKANAASAAANQQIRSRAAAAKTGTAAEIRSLASAADVHARSSKEKVAAETRARVASARPPLGGGEAEVASGKARIADTVNKKAAAELSAAARRTTNHVAAGAGKLKTDLYRPAQRAVTAKIDDAQSAGQGALGGARRSATQAITAISTQTTRAGDDAHRVADSGLRGGQAAAHQDLRDWAAIAKSRLRAVAGKFKVSLLDHAGSFAARLAYRGRSRRAARVAAEAITAAESSGAEVVASLLDNASSLAAGASSLAESHAAAVRSVGARVKNSAAATAAAAASAQDRSARAYTGYAADLKAHLDAELGSTPAKAKSGLGSEHNAALGRMDRYTAQTAAQQDSWTQRAVQTGSVASRKFESKAVDLASQARQQKGPPVQRLFESLFGPARAWLRRNLGDVLGGIVSGIMLALPAIAIAVVLVFCGPIGWGVLAALILVGIGLGIYSRFAEFEADNGRGPSFWEGVGLVLLGAADITGIPYIVEAIAGRRAFSPRPMDTFERWERGTEGVIFLILVLVGGGKKLSGKTGRGGAGGGRTTPVEPVVEPVGGRSGRTEPGPTRPREGPPEVHPVVEGAPLRPGESPAQFGRRLGAESKGKPSKFNYICGEINRAGLSQADAATAGAEATLAIPLRLFQLRVGPDIILSSVQAGPRQPILIVRPNGQIVRGRADIVPANPPSLERPVEIINIEAD